MKTNDATIDPYYLAAFLNSSFVRKQIDCLFTGNIQKILPLDEMSGDEEIAAAAIMDDVANDVDESNEEEGE